MPVNLDLLIALFALLASTLAELATLTAPFVAWAAMRQGPAEQVVSSVRQAPIRLALVPLGAHCAGQVHFSPFLAKQCVNGAGQDRTRLDYLRKSANFVMLANTQQERAIQRARYAGQEVTRPGQACPTCRSAPCALQAHTSRAQELPTAPPAPPAAQGRTRQAAACRLRGAAWRAEQGPIRVARV